MTDIYRIIQIFPIRDNILSFLYKKDIQSLCIVLGLVLNSQEKDKYYSYTYLDYGIIVKYTNYNVNSLYPSNDKIRIKKYINDKIQDVQTDIVSFMQQFTGSVVISSQSSNNKITITIAPNCSIINYKYGNLLLTKVKVLKYYSLSSCSQQIDSCTVPVQVFIAISINRQQPIQFVFKDIVNNT